MDKISFIGAGRMASAIVTGLINKGVLRSSQIACLSGSGKTSAGLAARTGVVAAASLSALLENADTVVLACKPQQLGTLDSSVSELTKGKLVISILTGKKLERLAKTFPHARNIVRSMPNTPGQIGAGVTAWVALKPLANADRVAIDTILGALGHVVAVDENQLDAVTGVSGSGPAYVFEFAAALRDAAVEEGLSREVAKQLATETLLGAAKLLAQSSDEAEILRDQVTSPNGTTYAALQRMAARDFRGLIKDAVHAATVRSVELSKD